MQNRRRMDIWYFLSSMSYRCIQVEVKTALISMYLLLHQSAKCLQFVIYIKHSLSIATWNEETVWSLAMVHSDTVFCKTVVPNMLLWRSITFISKYSIAFQYGLNFLAAFIVAILCLSSSNFRRKSAMSVKAFQWQKYSLILVSQTIFN